jgi:hypothetical protein
MPLRAVGMQIESERLGYWFLRLNGFLTTVNFVVHPGVGRDQGTDVDILGVRFPWRGEVIEEPMQDSPTFTGLVDRPYFAIAEVKTGLCDLNGPWSSPERRNLQQVLAAVGFCPSDDLDAVAQALYESGQVSGAGYYASLLCLGRSRNATLHERYPAVPQITWDEVLRFIHARFRKYWNRKVSHEQWDSAGHQLWRAVEASRGDAEAFIRGVEVVPTRRERARDEA